MCHIHHENSSDFIGNLANTCIVPFTSIGRSAGNNQFGTFGTCNAFELVVIDLLIVFANIVFERAKHDSRKVDRRAVRQVSTVRKIQPQKFIAGLEASQKNRRISLSARMRLHVHPFGIEKFFETIDGQLFTHIHNLTATIVTFSGITFGIFVRQNRTHSFEYLIADKVFRCN
ncbi:MAG: hypothetical protein BWZ06_01152 [Bacteroidetes bacterium ADurb.BinA261]|nr:MAG: hypothetical protein BWZ06_01152 [Bacteroidetes bacterium ADurb.BinA261]